ncbi:SDR family oxidoreductase [Acetobacter sp. DsW_063]|uniref:SDR family NAD(P)-dependent oxidoreductase n=1 Tax=Acetobacter sp. DsW_063 TaxID=1514894 RepID=UPI000A3D48E6|nr:SDR family NAD(P)-dependent oxidoreductase [Acetobacter sp. DsW_063]
MSGPIESPLAGAPTGTAQGAVANADIDSGAASSVGRAEGPLAGEVALVTGASRGIGRAVAVALATQGAHCVITARTVGGLEETDDLILAASGRRSTLLPLDLSDGSGADALGPSIAQRFGRLDLLVHAAATFVPLSPVAHIRDRDWEQTLGVNLTATMRLLRTTTPLLRAAAFARAVILINRQDAAPGRFRSGAAVCRAALEALVESWREEMTDRPNFHISLFDPGPTATRLRAQAFPGGEGVRPRTPDEAAATILSLLMPQINAGNSASSRAREPKR